MVTPTKVERPVTLICCVVKLVAVARPIVETPEFILPLKVVAVTTPVTNTSPITCRAEVGLVVPIPVLVLSRAIFFLYIRLFIS